MPGTEVLPDIKTPEAPEKTDGAGRQPMLTVVIIGLNTERTLAECIAAVQSARQSLGEVPVMYVDGGSTDRSTAIARDNDIAVIQLDHPHPTAGKGRNAGWKAAETPYVQFVDSDTTIDVKWLRKGLDALQADESIGCVSGKLVEKHKNSTIYNRVCNYDWQAATGDQAYCGGNAMYRLAVLQETGGFDEELVVGEEPDLCWRLRHRGYRVVYINAMLGVHDLNMSRFSQYWRRAVRSGYGYAAIGWKYAFTSDRLWLRKLLTSMLSLPFVAGFGLAALLLRNAIPIGILIAAKAFIYANKCKYLKRKGMPLVDRMLYAFHVYFVKLPLFVGTMRFFAGKLFRRPLRNRAPATDGPKKTAV